MKSELVSALVNSNKSVDLDKLFEEDIRVLEQNDEGAKLIFKNKIYTIGFSSSDLNQKEYNLLVNNTPVKVNLKSRLDHLIEKMGLNVKRKENLSQLIAPMPGLVLDIIVKIGDEVSDGDSLIILEAMKMENVIKAHGTAIVKSIPVKKGDKVDKGKLLIEFE